MMDTDEKLELERRLQNASTPGYRYSEDYYRKYFPNSPDLNSMIAEGQGVLDSLRNIHTDWFDELIHRSIYQRHNLSVRGRGRRTPLIIYLPIMPNKEDGYRGMIRIVSLLV